MYFDSQLTRGITHAETSVDFGHFKTVCYHVARVLDFNLINVWKRGESKASSRSFTYDNYHAALLEMSRGRIWLLCNAGFPVLAFTTALFDKRFVDMPQMTEEFSQIGEFKPLLADYLNQPLIKEPNSNFLALLSESEMRDIMSWSPDRVGDVIFNEWD